MKTYTTKLFPDEDGELLMEIPPEVIQELGWGLGDLLEWIDNKDGTFTLRKPEDGR